MGLNLNMGLNLTRGGGGSPRILTSFVDGLDEDPPTVSFTSSESGTLYIDLHSSATPPPYNTGDLDTLTQAISVGPQDIELDFSAYAGETFYVHFTLLYDTDQVSNTLTSQEVTVPGPSNFVVNGTFDTNLTGWAVGAGLSAIQNAGRAEITRSGGITTNNAFRQVCATPATTNLRLTFDFSNSTCGLSVYDSAGVEIVSPRSLSSSPASFDITSTANDTAINFWTADGTTVYLDNVSIVAI